MDHKRQLDTGTAISRHLKVLEKAGLVARSREAQWRPCRLQPAPLKDVSEWIATYREMWEERFDRLENYLREVQAHEAKSPRRARRSRKSGHTR